MEKIYRIVGFVMFIAAVVMLFMDGFNLGEIWPMFLCVWVCMNSADIEDLKAELEKLTNGR